MRPKLTYFKQKKSLMYGRRLFTLVFGKQTLVSENGLKVRKTTRGGGGGSKTSSLRSEELFSESEVVQSLSEFKVLVQRIIRKRTKKEITQAIIQVSSTNWK